MILGLDVSTSIVGVCIYDEDDGLVELERIDLRKEKNFFNKAKLVEIFLTNILVIHPQITSVFIEDILQGYSRGLSSAKTITQLARFNGIVSFLACKIFDVEPQYINVNTARKTLGIKIDKTSKLDKKEQVLLWADNDLGGYNWPKKTLKSGPRKGETELAKFCYDMADAYVIARAASVIGQQT